MAKSTNFLGNLRRLYGAYGGFWTLLASEYLWIAFLLAFLSPGIGNISIWTQLIFTVLPTLAGFSIAAYAIYFAVLSSADQVALAKPAEELNNRSPLAVTVSSISHAIIVQVLTILFALISYSGLPAALLVNVETFPDAWLFVFHWAAASMSYLGVTLLYYSILLVVGAVLSIFRMIEIKTRLNS